MSYSTSSQEESCDTALITPPPVPLYEEIRHPRENARRGSPSSHHVDRKAITINMPLIRGSLLLQIASNFIFFPFQTASERNMVFRANASRVKRLKLKNGEGLSPDDEPRVCTTYEIMRSHGIGSLYRGFPMYVLHELLVNKVRRYARSIIIKIRNFMIDPDSNFIAYSKFHQFMDESIRRILPQSKNQDDSDFSLQIDFSPHAATNDTMVMQYLHNQSDEPMDESLFVHELIEMTAELVAEVACYPLATIAQRQMTVEDDAGYTTVSMLNVSACLDGGYGWLYRGIEWRLAKIVLQSGFNIAVDLGFDSVDSIFDNPPLRESCKQIAATVTSPLVISSKLERTRSAVPGLTDEDIDYEDIFAVAITKNFRIISGTLAVMLPVGILGRIVYHKLRTVNE